MFLYLEKEFIWENIKTIRIDVEVIAETKVGEDELMDDLVDNHTTGNFIFEYHEPFKEALKTYFWVQNKL